MRLLDDVTHSGFMIPLKKVCLQCKEEFEETNADACPKDGGQLVPVAADPLVGTTFADKYQILKVLGSGGMSVIYQARHKYMERICAVKLLHPFLVADASMFQRFQYEAKAASNLNHPNVVGIHDFGITNDGRAYLVMDYLSGEDLSSILEREGVLPEEQAREIFRQAIMGLDHAHSKGVVHRDLKPSNLFLEPQEDGNIIVKLVDFGIAKISAPDDGSAQNLTRTGEVFGSPLYMSPEQCSGKSLDARSDMYSFGCVMYEVLTGRTPLVGPTALDTMHKHIKEKPMTPTEAAPRIVVSKELEKAIMRCLSKKASDRYDSMADLYEAIFGSKLPKLSSSLHGTSIQVQIRSSGTNQLTGTVTPSGTVVTGAATKPDNFASKITKTTIGRALAKPKAQIITLGSFSIFCSVMGVFVYTYFFWPGPVNDSGTFYNRNMYVILLGQADEAKRNASYERARDLYKKAEDVARTFSDRKGRLASVLRSELDLFSITKNNEGKARVMKELNETLSWRTLQDFDYAMKAMAVIEKESDKQNLSKGDRRILSKQLDNELTSVISGIIETGRRLEAANQIEKQEELLTKACYLYGKFASSDDPQLADLKTELALCHWQQDELDYVGPLLKQSLEIIREARTHNSPDVDEIDECETWLKLGQFDRDRGVFNEGREELQKAIELVNPYKTKNASKNAPGHDKVVQGKRLLAESINALSDLERQDGQPAQAEKLRLEAIEIKKGLKEEGAPAEPEPSSI